MPYYIYLVKPFAQLEKLAEFGAFSQASTRAKALRADGYQIEVFPTYSTIAAGHRLRVALSTTDAPHLVPTLPQQQELFGGVYEVQRTALAPSSLTVLLVNR